MGGVSASGRDPLADGPLQPRVYAISTRTGKLLHRIPGAAAAPRPAVWPQPGRYSIGHTGILPDDAGAPRVSIGRMRPAAALPPRPRSPSRLRRARPPPAARPDVDGCAGSWLRPVPANAAQVRAATLCLINAQRARNGRAPLTENAVLQRAAELHSLDMAKRKFFEHPDPDGVQPDARIVHQGYPPILVGENLAWGELAESTPAKIVSMWMKSPGHRANMLEPGYREIGIGFAFEAPEAQADAAPGGDLHDDLRSRRALRPPDSGGGRAIHCGGA